MDDERVSQDPTAENETDAEDRNDGDTSGTAAPRPVKHQRRLLLFVIAGAVLAADLLTKILAVANIEPGRPVWLIGDIVSLRLVRNPGAAFSMATGMTWLLTLVAVGVVIGVVRIGRTLRSPWWALGLGLVLGGALGNLVDRFFRAPGVMQGHVVDFVSVGWWPVFNVADSGIVCGAILLVVLTLIGLEPDGTRKGVEK
ncbi:signal peptidase II [Rhodococcus opacus]|uniref:Lipoprotein signal peptidase n=1 Tax=Rhodococcus opacus TaxID=37919 RepID=A0A1B1K9N1_RHOOP|nr:MULTISPECIES: signal peptidase II [Rhodococcus]ANS29288.1 Lipoprotein signal peptidase [Rhodococcus opacus]MCZ4586556.1 signal peptidase II [Rhodococcus opacus]MDI9934544.1 signal peptidase II [Rhodococcus sp. IEGM 1351]MDJ0417045.1 signal peptidase II [Rhodococcus opacus]MDV6247521.1 signal peptidase II [Rhodococcus opacus]